MTAPAPGADGVRADGVALRLDPTRCDGVGMCTHLAPRVVGVDPWGFPVLPVTPVGRHDLPAARAAVRACPHRALSLR